MAWNAPSPVLRAVGSYTVAVSGGTCLATGACELGAAPSIRGHCSPVIGPDDPSVGAQVDHWLNSEGHSNFNALPLSDVRVMNNLRVLVKLAPNAMTCEVTDDTISLRLGDPRYGTTSFALYVPVVLSSSFSTLFVAPSPYVLPSPILLPIP